MLLVGGLHALCRRADENALAYKENLFALWSYVYILFVLYIREGTTFDLSSFIYFSFIL